jgi:hypothetical protein
VHGWQEQSISNSYRAHSQGLLVNPGSEPPLVLLKGGSQTQGLAADTAGGAGRTDGNPGAYPRHASPFATTMRLPHGWCLIVGSDFNSP